MGRPVFLLSDFGLRDPFVGVMKAVVLRHSPGSQLVDLTHLVPPQDILAGAVAIEDALPWLPDDAVVLAVVDPGVGTDRRAIIAGTGGRVAVGPDNGLLEAFLAQPDAWCLELPAPPDSASATFHGRDVFAPAAGRLASGEDPANFTAPGAAPGADPIRLRWPRPEHQPDGSVALEVLALDHFGNCALNLRREDAGALEPPRAALRLGHQAITGLARTFGDAAPGEALFLWNSAGRLEIAVNGGSAAARFGLRPGSRVFLFPRGVPA